MRSLVVLGRPRCGGPTCLHVSDVTLKADLLIAARLTFLVARPRRLKILLAEGLGAACSITKSHASVACRAMELSGFGSCSLHAQAMASPWCVLRPKWTVRLSSGRCQRPFRWVTISHGRKPAAQLAQKARGDKPARPSLLISTSMNVRRAR